MSIARKTLTEEEEHNIQQLVYNFLKGQKKKQSQIKCSVDDGPVGELVEEITVNQAILVRLIRCHFSSSLFSSNYFNFLFGFASIHSSIL